MKSVHVSFKYFKNSRDFLWTFTFKIFLWIENQKIESDIILKSTHPLHVLRRCVSNHFHQHYKIPKIRSMILHKQRKLFHALLLFLSHSFVAILKTDCQFSFSYFFFRDWIAQHCITILLFYSFLMQCHSSHPIDIYMKLK